MNVFALKGAAYVVGLGSLKSNNPVGRMMMKEAKRTMSRCALLSLMHALVLVILCCRVYAEPLYLPEGLKMVTAESRLVKIREQEEKTTEADTLVARARLLPNVYASAGQSYLNNTPSVKLNNVHAPISQENYYAYSAAVQQILFDFMGTASQYKASVALLDAKRLDTKRTRNLVALDFAFLYFDALESEKLIAVAEKEKESLEAHLQVARDLHSSGVITKNDLLQAEVKLSDAKQKLLTAQNLRRINGARINTMLARSISMPVELMEPAAADREMISLEAAADKAEKERPEVQMVDTTMKGLGFEETARKSEYYPRFLAQGGYNYTENRYQVYEGIWSVNLLMNINIFSGGATKAELDKIRSRKMTLAVQKKKLLEDIRLELEKYYLDCANAKERIVVTKSAIAQSEENLRINKARYAEGVGLALDVTDAIALQSLAETNYYKSLYDYYRSEAGYLYAIGRELREAYQ
ncbi:MAG TPA: TolC family protein [Syntrophorhabdales bacterium]|nr:TolC family protein [Syntrophorhabdales bacterium]